MRRIVTRVTQRAERSADSWVPSDDPTTHSGEGSDLRSATTADAMRTALRRGAAVPWTPEARRKLAFDIGLRGGYFTHALLQWCLDHASDPHTLVRALCVNPAVTPAQMVETRKLLEAYFWSPHIREGSAVGADRPLPDVTPGTRHATLAWLVAQHPMEHHRDWPSFMMQAVRRQLDSPHIRAALMAPPNIPDALLAEAKDRAWPGDANLVLALLRRTPCPVTAGDMETLFRPHAYTVSPSFLAQCFVAAPIPLQDACWRSALAVAPLQIAVAMVAQGARVWPGLTAEDLSPVLACSVAEARLAAIRLLTALPQDPQPPRTASTSHDMHGDGLSAPSVHDVRENSTMSPSVPSRRAPASTPQ